MSDAAFDRCVNRILLDLEPVFMLNTSVRDEVETSSAFKSIVESLKLVVVAISCNEPCVLVAAWDVGRVSCHKNNVLWVYQVQKMAVCASADATRSGEDSEGIAAHGA